VFSACNLKNIFDTLRKQLPKSVSIIVRLHQSLYWSYGDMPVSPFFVRFSDDFGDEGENGYRTDEKHGLIGSDIKFL
jgi:hypothetical protein